MKWFLIASAALSGHRHLALSADDFHDHRYKSGDVVDLWVNKVGPYANPQQAYEYYSLPYCAPETRHHPDNDGGSFNKIKPHSLSWGKRFGGLGLVSTPRHSGHDLVFRAGATEACTTDPLTEKQAGRFGKAAWDQWFYQWEIDGLPVWGMVGEMLPDLDDLDLGDREESLKRSYGEYEFKPYIYTKRTLRVSYNKDRIIRVDLTSEPASLTEIKAGARLKFELDVQWETTEVAFEERFDRYLDHEFFRVHSASQRKVHWVGILCLSVTAYILRMALKKDYARYSLSHNDEEAAGRDDEGIELRSNGIVWLSDSSAPLIERSGEDAGWKLVHGDVFRAPPNLPLLSSLIGCGWQLATILLAASLMLSNQEEEASALLLLTLFLMSSLVAGVAAGSYFKMYSTQPSEGGDVDNDPACLKAVMAYTTLLLPTAFSGVILAVNSIALAYRTVYYIPFGVTTKPFLLWIIVGVPTGVVGVLAGNLSKFRGDETNPFPCRVIATPRPIPTDVKWYFKPLVLCPIVGLASFGSIVNELHYFMATLWKNKFFLGGGLHAGVLALLCLVAGTTTIIVVYICLKNENHLWQWISFYAGGSITLFVLAYSIYYYSFRTQMHGLFQNCVYFGTMSLVSAGLGVLCGTISHFAANRFVRAIFKNVKID